MKNLLIFIALFLTSSVAIAQGWVGNNTLNLFTVDGNNFINPNIRVGIGLSSPSTQLHTNGGVRFEGLGNNNSLTRVIVSDGVGNLSWRDATTLTGSNDDWKLAGNSIVSGQFLGTTNNEALRFRAANTERMTISTTGNVGINNTNPQFFSLDMIGGMRITGVAGSGASGQAPGIHLEANPAHGGYLGFRNWTGVNFDIIQGGRCGVVNTNNLNFIASEEISERELQVLKLICQQQSSTEIAQKLHISPRTVDGHRNSLLAKTDSKNIVGLVVYAIQNKLFLPEMKA